jgi:hypothetical protein
MSHAERAETILNDFLKENPQFIEVSSTDPPVILGECSFTPSSRAPLVQYVPAVTVMVGPATPTYVFPESRSHVGRALISNQDQPFPTGLRDVPQVRTRFRPLS